MSTRQIDIGVLALVGAVIVLGIIGGGAHEIALALAVLLEVIGQGLFVFTFAQRLIAAQGAGGDGPSARIDIALIAVTAGIIGLGIAGKTEAALGIAAVVGALGAVFFLVAFTIKVLGAMQPHAEADFTSLSPSEEKSFLPHEHAMQTNTKRAAVLGLGVTAAVFVVTTAVTLGLYTPCSAFCAHPPSVCSSDAEKAAFMSACDSSCGTLRTQHGDEFIDKLSGCAFSASTSGGCEEPTKAAVAAGIWCASK